MCLMEIIDTSSDFTTNNKEEKKTPPPPPTKKNKKIKIGVVMEGGAVYWDTITSKVFQTLHSCKFAWGPPIHTKVF